MNPAETGEVDAHLHADPAAQPDPDPQHDPFAEEEEREQLPAPSPILDRLQEAYAEHNAEQRRKTFQIVPGRYNSMLAFRAAPIEDEKFRKEAERAQRRGIGSGEAEVAFAAKVIAHSCETILVADGEGGDLRPAEDVVAEFAGTGPVRFDSRLCQMLGIEPVPSSEAAIARLVYSNKQAMRITLRELLAFFSEETAGDDDDEEDETERPT